MTVDVRVLGPGDAPVLRNVATDVFDHPIDPGLAAEFLSDPRHHLAVALDAGVVIAFASGVAYVHPDKPAELWVNEVGVAPSHRRQGIAKRVVGALFEAGRAAGCLEAWVLADRSNAAARRVYESLGGHELPEANVMYAFVLDP